MEDNVINNVQNVREKIAVAAESTGRNADEILLVAVSKRQPVEKIFEAYKAGITVFGENQVQELLQKQSQVDLDIQWHLIGHLQSNKVNKVFDRVAMIQSVDRISLLDRLDTTAESAGRTVELLLQVNTSGEASKFGFAPQAVEEVCAAVEKMKALRVSGLMTIGPLSDDLKIVSRAFADLRRLFENLAVFNSGNIRMKYLSMGMSGDFELAIREGSNLVRIGTSIFGERQY